MNNKQKQKQDNNSGGLKKISSPSILSLLKPPPSTNVTQKQQSQKNNNNNYNRSNNNKTIGIKRENDEMKTSSSSSDNQPFKKQKKDNNESIIPHKNTTKDTEQNQEKISTTITTTGNTTTTTITTTPSSKKEERKYKSIIENISETQKLTTNFLQDFDKLFYCPNSTDDKKKKKKESTSISVPTEAIQEINTIINQLSSSFQVPTDIINEFTLYSKIISRYSTIQRKFISYRYLKFSKKKIQQTIQLLQTDNIKQLFETLQSTTTTTTTTTKIPSKELVYQLILYLNSIFNEIVLSVSVMMEGGHQIGAYLLVGHFAKLSMLSMACLAKIHSFFQSINQSIIISSIKLDKLVNSFPNNI